MGDNARPNELDASHPLRLADSVTRVPVEDEAVLYDDATNALHRLDPIGALVVRLFDGRATVAELVDDLAAAFEAPRERIHGDVAALVRTLADNGLLAGVPGTVEHDPDRRIERALVDGC